jgi:hypothetical protein
VLGLSASGIPPPVAPGAGSITAEKKISAKDRIKPRPTAFSRLDSTNSTVVCSLTSLVQIPTNIGKEACELIRNNLRARGAPPFP